MAKLIRVDGSESEVSELSSQNLEKAICGKPMLIPIGDKIMVVDNDAMVFGKSCNSKATQIYQSVFGQGFFVRGDVVILEKKEKIITNG